MDTTTLKERQSLQEDAMFEDENAQDGVGMTDEELKIEALKIATNIGKLMSNVTTDDIVNIAETVAKFIKGGESASLETTTEESSEDNEEDFDTSDETTEESTEESNQEESEDFEV